MPHEGQLPAGAASVPPQAPVRVNRTRPTVAPPRQVLVFSNPPSDREITAARVFPEPLVPLGGEWHAAENAALARHLTTWAGERGETAMANRLAEEAAAEDAAYEQVRAMLDGLDQDDTISVT